MLTEQNIIFYTFIPKKKKKKKNERQKMPGRVAQSVVRLTQESEVPVSIPGWATYFRFSFRRFKKGSCQLRVKVCARSTG